MCSQPSDVQSGKWLPWWKRTVRPRSLVYLVFLVAPFIGVSSASAMRSSTQILGREIGGGTLVPESAYAEADTSRSGEPRSLCTGTSDHFRPARITPRPP